MIRRVSQVGGPTSGTLPRLEQPRQQGVRRHQAYLSTQETLPPPRARLPSPDERAWWCTRGAKPPSQGPAAADQLEAGPKTLGERFGDPGVPSRGCATGTPEVATSSAASASSRFVSEQRIPLGSPCRRHGREWAAWAPKIRRGLFRAQPQGGHPLREAALAASPAG